MAMKWLGPGLVLVCALVVMARPLAAHPVPFSYLDVQLRPSAIDVSLVVHIFDVAHDLEITPMERLLESAVVAEREQAIRSLLVSRLALAVDGRPLSAEWSPPEILHDRQSLRHPQSDRERGADVYERDELTSQVILDRAHARMEYFAGTRQGVLAVVRKFVPSGIHHILIGPDHLLFLVGLLLLGGSIRQLLLVVTSFTVAHSITLSLAALNILSPPARLIEPAIALSIVYVGADNLLARGGRDVRAWIALTFGFIHGFGFANVLREMGLPSRAL